MWGAPEAPEAPGCSFTPTDKRNEQGKRQHRPRTPRRKPTLARVCVFECYPRPLHTVWHGSSVGAVLYIYLDPLHRLPSAHLFAPFPKGFTRSRTTNTCSSSSWSCNGDGARNRGNLARLLLARLFSNFPIVLFGRTTNGTYTEINRETRYW